MSLLDAIDALAEEQANDAKGAASVAPATTRTASAGAGDAEIKQMLAEAPLIDLVRADTGEIGRQSGDYVAFHHCPVCGHSDCFRYYPDTNTWACFGESNASEYKGGSFIEYQRAAHGMDAKEAVRALREATGHPYGEHDGEPDKWYDFEGNVVTREAGQDSAGEEGEADNEAPKLLLPPWERVRAVDPPKRAPSLIDGLLRKGHVGIISGKGKSGKSWSAIELSVAVATGRSWLGFACARGRVLFCDPELDRRSLDNRFAAVARAMGADASEVEANVVRWSLRGVMRADGEPPTVADLAHDIAARCAFGDFALVVLDSCSCFVKGAENDNGDVSKFFAHVGRIAESSGASVLCVHHYGKGAAGDRESADRARGASKFLDSPDCVLALTELFPPEGNASDYLSEGARAFELDFPGLREFPSKEPIHLFFSYPVHVIDSTGVTADWKARTSQGKGGKKTGEGNRSKSEARADRCTIELLAHFLRHGIGSEGLPMPEAAEIVSEAIGETVKPATLRRYCESSEKLDVYKKSARRFLVVPSHPSPDAPEEEPPEEPTLDYLDPRLAGA